MTPPPPSPLGMFGFLLPRVGPSDLVGTPMVCWIPLRPGGGLSSLVRGPFSLMVSLLSRGGLIWLHRGFIACWALYTRILFHLYLCSSEMEVVRVQIEAPLRCRACAHAHCQTYPHLGALLFTYMCSQFLQQKINISFKNYFISLVQTSLSF